MSERDITLEQQLAQLRQENQELRAALDALPIAILVKDRDGRFLYVNPVGAPGYGVSEKDMVGRSEDELLPPGNDLVDWRAKDQEVIDNGVPLSIPDHPFRTSEGRLMPLVLGRYPIRWNGAPAVLVTAFDSTRVSAIAQERSRLERKLAETQRLEGLGLMAGGIAHDFNNLLVGVFANADMAMREVGQGTRAATFISRLKLAAQRLANLSRQMLAYSGRSHVESERLDVSAVASEILDLVRATVPSHISLTASLPEHLPSINADRAQVTQVIMNLVTNAAEAIGGRTGHVHVAVRAEHFDTTMHASLTVRSRREPGEYVCLDVTDDGPGMDNATRDRIFDPFFTTKATGRGLGLASVLGIVRAHHGALQVDTAPGQGARMRVWFPPADRVLKVAARMAQTAAVQSIGRRVLVVDDEPVVREATSSLLESFGFEVHTAADGDSALAKALRGERFDVVLLDMTMPGLTVADTHSAVREAMPEVPILLCSGYTEPSVLEELLRRRATAFLQKPYSSEQLLQSLDAIMQ